MPRRGAARLSRASASLMTVIISAASATVRVMGPAWARVPKGLAGQWGTSLNVGLWPTMPQKPAGMRMEPPASVPSAMGAMPADTAAALPPLLPPAVLLGSQGLLVGPHKGLSVIPFQPNSGVVVLPSGT